MNTGPGERASRKGIILVIGDNATNLDLITKHLGEDDFEILVAEDGMVGLERAKHARPDLILLDVLMPDMDGFETCRRLKAEETTREIPVIFMTALTETEHKLKGFAAGAVDYVTKPAQREELLARVRVHLQIRELTYSLRAANERLESRVEERTRELARTNAAYKALSECNEVLVRTTEEAEVLRDSCRIIVEDCGYPLVWIGFAEHDEARTVRPVAQSGHEEGYLESIKVSWADDELGRGPTGTAIRTKQPVINRDVLTNPSFAPWRAEASFPLLTSANEAIGAMSVYASQPDAFAPEEIHLLTELADDLAFGIVSLRTRAERDRAAEALRESEELYRITMANILDPVFITDDDGRFTFICSNIEHVLGYTSEEVQALGNIAQLLGNRPFSVEELQQRGEILNLERTVFDKQGRARAYLVSAKRVYIKGGTVLYTFHEITERKRAEEELRRSEEKYRRLVENLRREYFFYSHGTDGIFTYLSPSITNVLGYSSDEFMTNYTEFLTDHPMNQEARLHTEFSIQGLQQPSYEIEIFHKDCAIRNLEVTEFPLFDSKGNVVSVEGIAHDITERRRAEEMVRNSLAEAEAARDKIDAIVKSVPNGLIVTDLGGRITLVNRAAESMLGASQEELLQRPAGEVIGEDTFHRHLDATLCRAVPAVAVELELMDHGRGEMRTVQAGTSLVRTREGVPTGAVILLRDVTREREIARMKNEFISTAAHELNTPLTMVMGYLELLLKQAELGEFSAEEQREFLSVIYEKSEVLSRIVDDLLQLSRLEEGQALPLEKSPFEVQKVIRDAVDLFRGVSAHRFELHLREEPMRVFADRGKIEQVLKNLISNAVKFSPAGSPIRVACTSTNDEVQISVEDEGLGMTAEQATRAFEKFYRADASDTAIGGIGLGMSIAKNIVEAQGGRIWVESRLGEGTRTTFVIPASGLG
jgi:PAS domain S-box-containing protein